MSPNEVEEEQNVSSDGSIEVPVEKHRASLATEPSATSLEDGDSSQTPCPTAEQSPVIVKKVDSPKKTRMSRREWALVALGVIALVGLGVGLGVALAPSDDETETVSQSSSAFSESAAVIQDVCVDEFAENECRDACQEAECCTVASGRNSCLSTNANQCFAYSKCHMVLENDDYDSSSSIPPAPSDLYDVCASDLTSCREKCQAAECCFTESDEMESCQATRLLACMDYAPCQVLRGEYVLTPANTSELAEICSTPSEECSSVCQAASCCWNRGEDSCFQSDFISCLTYAPCQELRLRPPLSVLERPKVNVEQVCGIDSLLTADGYEECAQVCKDATCCFATNPPYNCFKNDPFGCLYYGKCELLPLAGGSVPRAPSNINDICKDVYSLDATELQTCLDACKPSACCASQDDNCYDQGNVLACDEYKICKPLYGVLSQETNTLRSPPETLRLCTPENVATASGFTYCKNVCEPAECCNSMGDDSCLLDNIVTCAEWNIGGCHLLATTAARGGQT